MKVVGLVSGGKDSCFAMMKCLHYGHQIVALANLMPADDSVDELDSYMYQTVGHQIVAAYAKCMGVPLFRRKIQGSTRHQNLSYSKTPGDEVEDMFILLQEVQRQMPSVTAVSSGAIASDYQRLRVESVCSRLGLISLAYLWKQDQSFLLQEMEKAGIVAILVKVAAIGLDPSKHLGKEVSYMSSHLHKLKELYGINVCGEGGEYETLTLDCPLFKNAHISLDEHQIILHSSDSIAPVGILHPSVFHLEVKPTSCTSDYTRNNGVCPVEVDSVCEVQGDFLQTCDVDHQSDMALFDVTTEEHCRVHISRTGRNNLYTISCWLQSFNGSSGDVQEDLKVVLREIELQLVESSRSWEDVLYVHLYLADMNDFTIANETYVKFITQENCPFGVPSRSTIEVPLLQAGLGAAYIEVLVAKEQCKKVLHVQSISCWAPSCIGPYSQATLHKEILYMAGQLGLDPPTMSLCDGGPTVEMEQALLNSEEVAKCFKCSISTSAILFVIYCSAAVPTSELIRIQEKHDTILKKMKILYLDDGEVSALLNPMLLYVLVPSLPKRAFVEVKPILHVADGVETEESVIDYIIPDQSSKVPQTLRDFQHRQWHDSCIQKCIIKGKICGVVLSIANELGVKICSDDEPSYAYQDGVDHQNLDAHEYMERIARFCLYQLGRILLESCFSWDDAVNLRFYYSTSLQMSHATLLHIFTDAFNELAESISAFGINEVPIFNLVPVLGAGRSAASIDNVITCELLATKS